MIDLENLPPMMRKSELADAMAVHRQTLWRWALPLHEKLAEVRPNWTKYAVTYSRAEAMIILEARGYLPPRKGNE